VIKPIVSYRAVPEYRATKPEQTNFSSFIFINHTLRHREYEVIEDDAALKLD